MRDATARESQSFSLDVAGLGIVFFSPFAVAAIAEGEDFLAKRYMLPADVANHVNACTISAFCTGSPGIYTVRVENGRPSNEAVAAAQFSLRLGLEVRGGSVHFRDLYDLMNWTRVTPASQVVSLDDGFYLVTVLSSLPTSGLVGDEQIIELHFELVSAKPQLQWTGVPQLCD
jgi:hypothetical protein